MQFLIKAVTLSVLGGLIGMLIGAGLTLLGEIRHPHAGGTFARVGNSCAHRLRHDRHRIQLPSSLLRPLIRHA